MSNIKENTWQYPPLGCRSVSSTVGAFMRLNSWRGLCRFGGFFGNADRQGKYTSVLGTDSNIRVAFNVNSCSYTHCVSLFPTLHTNRHSPRRESTAAFASGDRYRRCIPGGNEGALGSCVRGGGWEVKNARCGKHGDLVDEGVRRCYLYGGSTDPVSKLWPTLTRQPGKPFSTVLRDTTPVRQVRSLVFAQLAMGCSTINIGVLGLN